MYNYFAILPVVSALLCVVLGLFAFSRNPRHPANIGFLLGMASLALIEAGNAMVLLSHAEWQIALPGMRLAMRGEAALPVAWLFFSIVFARANYKEILLKWALALLFTVTVSLVFIVWAGSPSFIASQSSGIFHLGSLGWYFHLYLLLGLVLNLINLENTLRSSSGTQRQQIKYIIFGVGAILAFFVYLSSQALLFSKLDRGIIPLKSAVILISTFIAALSIVKYRLLNVDIYVSRHIAYNSITVLIIGIYLIAVGLITQGIKFFNIPFNYFFATFFIFIALLAMVIFLYTDTFRRKVLVFINRHFYRHKYDFREKWMETIDKISSKRTVEEIQQTLTDMITASMGARTVYFWYYEPVSNKYIAFHNDRIEESICLGKSHPLLAHIKSHMAPFMMKDCSGGTSPLPNIDDEVLALAVSTETVLCAPLMVNQEIAGFILQGEDISGEPYVENDFEYLKTLTTQAAVQIKNVLLTQDLMTAREIDTFNHMTSFIMHDLKNLTNSLALVSQNARHNIDNPEFQRDAIKTIDTTVSRMKGLIEKLSTASIMFEIKKSSTELDEVINKAIAKVVVPREKRIALTKEVANIPSINVDSQAVEMVIFNIVSNAFSAIEREGIVRLTASVEADNMVIAVADNGVGIPSDFLQNSLFRPFKTSKKTGFGIGLYQCKTIIEAHGGSIEVESELRKGTTFTIRLPLQ